MLGSSDRYANIPNHGNKGAKPVDSEEEAGFNLALFTAVVATTIIVVVQRFPLVRIELSLGVCVVHFHGDIVHIIFLGSETRLGVINVDRGF